MKAKKMAYIKKYILNVLVGIDITLNAIVGGKERQTISGRLGSDFKGSMLEMGVNYVFYKLRWWGDDDHCSDEAAFENGFVK